MRAAALMILLRVTLEGRVGIPGSHFKRLFEHVYPSGVGEIKQFECWDDFLYVAAHSIRASSQLELNLLFRRKTTSENPPPLPADMCPGQISWNYDRAESIAAGILHAAVAILGLLGGV